MSILLWYIVLSYMAGFALFAIETYRALKSEEYHLLGFGIVLLLLSPLTAWHGVLHYLALWWSWMNNTKFKPWI